MAWPPFISNRIIALLKLTVLFIQSSFLIVLFPKAVFNISNVSCLEFLFATQNVITDRCSRAAFLLIRSICATRFCLTSNGVKIGIVTSLASTSNQDRV